MIFRCDTNVASEIPSNIEVMDLKKELVCEIGKKYLFTTLK